MVMVCPKCHRDLALYAHRGKDGEIGWFSCEHCGWCE